VRGAALAAPLALFALAAPGAQPPARAALIDAAEVVPGLILDLRYATEENFVHRRLYASARCLLRPSVAARLAAAQAALERRGYRLKVFDCYRPFSVQKAMWEAMPRRGLVAPPSLGGSHHNRGAAVDASLVRKDGSPVEMPTEFDDFSRAARINSPLPSQAAQRHRAILQEAMTGAGFKLMYMEWWHFEDPEALGFSTLDEPL
jgi:zinc D-Ala-D-Ala dipeptidase